MLSFGGIEKLTVMSGCTRDAFTEYSAFLRMRALLGLPLYALKWSFGLVGLAECLRPMSALFLSICLSMLRGQKIRNEWACFIMYEMTLCLCALKTVLIQVKIKLSRAQWSDDLLKVYLFIFNTPPGLRWHFKCKCALKTKFHRLKRG